MTNEGAITESWLTAHGWKLQSERNDPNTRCPGFRLRAIGHELSGGRGAFHSFDDLCIAVAPALEGQWYVWIYQLEPYRHIHVRHMRLTKELVRLWEGLTGSDWPTPDGGANADSYKLNPGGRSA